jgi:hypothetical protein
MVAHLPGLDALFVKGKYIFYEDVNLQKSSVFKNKSHIIVQVHLIWLFRNSL